MAQGVRIVEQITNFGNLIPTGTITFINTITYTRRSPINEFRYNQNRAFFTEALVDLGARGADIYTKH